MFRSLPNATELERHSASGDTGAHHRATTLQRHLHILTRPQEAGTGITPVEEMGCEAQ